MNREILERSGISYDRGLARCMNDRSFYRMFLEMFLEDDSFQRMEAAYLRKDMRDMFACAHEFKGACGNAAMTDLFDAVCPLVEYIRDSDGEEARVDELFDQVQTQYHRARRGVETALEKEAV